MQGQSMCHVTHVINNREPAQVFKGTVKKQKRLLDKPLISMVFNLLSDKTENISWGGQSKAKRESTNGLEKATKIERHCNLKVGHCLQRTAEMDIQSWRWKRFTCSSLLQAPENTYGLLNGFSGNKTTHTVIQVKSFYFGTVRFCYDHTIPSGCQDVR